LQQAQQIIDSKNVIPGKQEETLVINAEKAVAETIRRINTFFDGNWKNYRQLVESTKLNLFKDYKPIE
jgi:hypothetical protein